MIRAPGFSTTEVEIRPVMRLRASAQSMAASLFRVVVMVVVLATGTATALVGVRQIIYEGPVTISGFAGADRALVAAAIARFEETGFTLPNTHVLKGASATECGRRGYARETWPVYLAVICDVGEATIVHELAHVWLYANLDRSRREEWRRLRGAAAWSSRAVPWADRASEHAADIITWFVLWKSEDGIRARVSGENTMGRYLRDVEWLTVSAVGGRAD